MSRYPAINWTEELESTLLQNISDGMTVKEAAKASGMSPASILVHCKESQSFCNRYARAMEVRQDADFESLEDDLRESPRTVKGYTDPGWVQWKRLQVDTRKWILAKRAPKKYGERVVHAGDEDAPVELVVKHIGSKE